MTLFYVIAAGPSYMDVTEDEWDYLKDKHTLTFTRVPYGSRKFEYYMSIEREALDKSVLTYMTKLGYLDTKLLLSIPESLQLAKELGFRHIQPVVKQNFYFLPSRRPWFVDEEYPPHKFKECRAKVFRQPLFRYRGQLSAAINCALILGATEIRLIGVDLYNQMNFYQYEEILRKLCKDEKTINEYIEHDKKTFERDLSIKKEKYPEYNKDTTHTTNMPYYEEDRWGKRPLRGVVDVIQWMDKELREEGMEGIYITNKKSLLYTQDKIQYRGITDGFS